MAKASRRGDESAVTPEQSLAILSALLESAFPLGLRRQLDSLARRYVSDPSGPPNVMDRAGFEVALARVAERWGLARPGVLPMLERVVVSRWRPKVFQRKQRRRSGKGIPSTPVDESFEQPALGLLRVTIEWYPDASPEYPEELGEAARNQKERWVVPTFTYTEARKAVDDLLRELWMPRVEPRRLLAFAELYGEGRERAPKRLPNLDVAARCYLAWAASRGPAAIEVDGVRTSDPYEKAAAWYRKNFPDDPLSRDDNLPEVIRRDQDKVSRWLNALGAEREIPPS